MAVNLPSDAKGLFLNQTKFRQTVESSWVDLLMYTHPQTRKKYTKSIIPCSIICHYFLKKQICKSTTDIGYIYSSDSGFCIDHLNQHGRHVVSKELIEQTKPTTEAEAAGELTETTPQQAKRKRIETAKELTIKDTINKLYNRKLHTQEKWMLGHPDSYIQNIAQPGGEQLIRATLEIVGLKMATEKTAYQLIIAHPTTDTSYKKLKAWKLIKKNGFNPYKVYHAIACCLNKQMGKRNTILLQGPASTGKSLLAQKIAHLVGNVGCYNASNVNFPFNDCTRKNLIWVEEAGNFGTQVNQFKTIMSGQTIRIDQKGKGSQTIEPTPVIMTTNEDITRVTIGCEYKPEHKQPIMDRCINIHMTNRLPGDFGLLDDTDIPTIFKALEKKGFLPTMSSYTSRWGGPPTWNEDWDTEANKLKQPETVEEETSSSQQQEKPSLAAALGADAAFQQLLDEIDDDEMWRATEGYGQELDATN